MGRIRHIVSSAHRWGGDGSRPSFRKIRRVLLAKHPEVIAKAFGGNASVAAAWIKNNWYRMRGQEPPPTRGRKSMKATLSFDLESAFAEAPAEFFGDDSMELFCSSDQSEREGKLIWTTALRTGEWKVNPIVSQRHVPLRITKEFMDDVLTAWKEKAWEYVTVPTYHTDSDPLANTGYVRKLKITPDPSRKGEYLLRAAIEFTEPEVAEKVLRGSIAGVSVNVKTNVQHQETGKFYDKVLTHLCLTNIPFINGLDAFKEKLAATNEADESLLKASYVFEDDEAPLEGFMDELLELAKSAFDVERDYEYVRQQVQAQLKNFYLDPEGDLVDLTGNNSSGEYQGDKALSKAYVYVKGMTANEVLVCAHSESDGEHEQGMVVGDHNGSVKGWVFEYEVSDEGEVVIDPIDEWKAVEKTWVTLSREYHTFGNTNDVTISDNDKTLTRGGDKMADVKNDEVKEPEVKEPEVKAPEAEALTLTRDELDSIAQERAESVLAAYREEQKEREESLEQELAFSRRRLHEMEVADVVAKLNEAGHAPSVVKTAQDIMLADVKKEPVLSLSREKDGETTEVQLSATQIVTELLDSLPATALDQGQPETADLSRKPEDSKSRADELYEELYGPSKTN